MKIESEVPKFFHSEPRRLKQILFNLIGNAIKFTFDGEINIHVKKIDSKNLTDLQQYNMDNL